MPNILNTLAAVRTAPHAVDKRRLTVANIELLLSKGFLKTHRDDANKVFTPKDQRSFIDQLIEGVTPQELGPDWLSPEAIITLRYIRSMPHAVSVDLFSTALAELTEKGWVRMDKRDTTLTDHVVQRYFVPKGKRAAADAL
jgi:hypothetical protein